MRFHWKPAFLAFVAVSLAACVAGCDGKSGGIVPPADAQSSSDVLTWTPPTERVDGTPLPVQEIGGYRVYFAIGDGPLGQPIDVSGGSTTSYEVPRALDGRRCYAMTTVDTNAQESARSETVCSEKCPTGFVVTDVGTCAPPSLPRPPGNVTVE